MNAGECLLVKGMLDPDKLDDISAPEWDLLIRQGRAAMLLPRLARRLAAVGGLAKVPDRPRAHLAAAQTLAQRQNQQMSWELRCIAEALKKINAPVVLLKGAAYLAANMSAAQGRLFSDIDLLVPRESLRQVEVALMMAGWASGHHSAYDQRYYRKWMHEIPPMLHHQRGSVIDLHHALLPLSARLGSDPAPLFAAARPVPGHPRFLTLSPPDVVLHSATHLFHEGEFERGLRDLMDMDALLREFGQQDGFWPGLEQRARLLNLERPLYYALRYCRTMLGTPIPAGIVGQPPALPGLMDALFERALMPHHTSCSRMGTEIARGMLYIRSHWLRMPPHLLLPHLLYKATFAKLQD